MKSDDCYVALKKNYPAMIDGVDMPLLEISKSELITVAKDLQSNADYQFAQLSDLCGIDYMQYGVSEWRTESTTATGYSRGRHSTGSSNWLGPRFAVVYHILSHVYNKRLRLRVMLEEEDLDIPSVIGIWPAANWYEREAFDLFGINFVGHPDMRRILTDYGFQGHPFRKDFPLQGEVEMRYDATLQKCIYEPVTIQNRVLVPRVIRNDSRYVGRSDNNTLDSNSGTQQQDKTDD